MIPTLYFSERLKWLASQLAEKLRVNNDPFRRRWVIVPHGGMKGWLMRHLVSEMPDGRLVGIEFLTWRDLLQEGPSKLEVTLRLLAEDPMGVAALLPDYWLYGAPEEGWQKALFDKVYVKPAVGGVPPCEELHLFGIDEMPPCVWEWLFRCGVPLTGYMFSPSAQYWGDVLSDRERRFQKKYEERMPLLGNWGRLGRRTLELLDRFEWHGEEDYRPESGSALADLKREMLFLEPIERWTDSTLQVVGAGASRMGELEVLRSHIRKWEGPLSEIVVLTPQLDAYLPLLPLVFGDEIPWSVRSEAMPNGYSRAVELLIRLSEGRWEAEAVLELLETGPFKRAAGFTTEEGEAIRDWVEAVRVRHGYEGGRGSWEGGFEAMVRTLFTATLTEEATLRVQGPLLERLIGTLDALHRDLHMVERTPLEWGAWGEHLLSTYLAAEGELEEQAERKAHALMQELKQIDVGPVPFAPIRTEWLQQAVRGSHRSSELESVRFASLHDGAIAPCQMLIWLGMDEEKFPTREIPHRCDLLKGKRIAAAERERYLLLKSLFQAEEKLLIVFRSISEEDGKEMPPALPIQELQQPVEYAKRKPRIAFQGTLSFPLLAVPEVEPLEEISLSELRRFAKSPWGFYLEEVCGIRWDQEEAREARLDDFLLSPLDKWRAEQVQLKGGEPLLPLGPFGAIARESMRELAQLGPVRAESVALQVELSPTHKVRVRGRLSLVTQRGYPLFKKCDTTRLVAEWPQLLAYWHLPGVAQTILLPYEGKEKRLELDPTESLRRYIAFYLRCRKVPSPLTRRFAGPLLGGRAELGIDRAYEWVAARTQLPKLEEVMEVWGPVVRPVFAPLLKGDYAEV